MREHLAKVKIEALDILDTLSKWLSTLKKDDYTLAQAEPKLEKCVATALATEINHLWNQAVSELYTTNRPNRWVVFRSKEVARVGTLRDQYIIPIQIPDTARILDGSGTQVLLTRESAIFCASGKTAFMSAGVVFFVMWLE